jgi:renalase
MTRVAVIGAGLAGLTLARRLSGSATVTVFEKSNGYGGRMATRYASPYAFDHGAQFFIAKSAEFSAELRQWQADGIIAPWRARFAELNRDQVMALRSWDDEDPHYVAVPGMNQLGKHLAEGLDIQLQTQVAGLQKHGSAWRLLAGDATELGLFDWVVSTAPAAQTAALLPNTFAQHTKVQSTQMAGCVALMLGFKAPVDPGWQAALVHDADISWIAVNSSKPQRPEPCTLVIHSTNSFADQSLDKDAAGVAAQLKAELAAVAGIDAAAANFESMHQWRYANAPRQKMQAPLIDVEQQLAACGDWCIRGRVEAAYLSARGLADELGELLG